MRVRPLAVAAVAVLAGVTVNFTGAVPATGQEDLTDSSAGPVAPLGQDGSWLVDAEGRVVLLHGFNEVYKEAPWYPAADDFGPPDADLLADHGFNVVRLGVYFQALMPQPPEPGADPGDNIDRDYIENLATTVDDLADQGIFVLLDFHQDGYGPVYSGNGFPEWMSIDDGEFNNPDTEFPLYYIENPAMQRAFENFWANREVAGQGLQDHYMDGLDAVVARFADHPNIIGYEPMNEPWAGEVCQDVAGCLALSDEDHARLEQERLVPFYERVTATVREHTSTQQIWVEPFVLFNFGQYPTTLPGSGADNVLSWHSYALDVAGEEAVAGFAREAADRDQVPAVATEFGATTDVETTERILGQIEGGRMGWMFWAYNEYFTGYGDRDDDVPRIDQLRNPELFEALVRPYPTAVTGTPTATGFDPATMAFGLTYDTSGPSGQTYGDLETVVEVPELRYPDGYTVEVTGAEVTSEDDASELTLVNEPGADQVEVCVLPAGAEAGTGACGDTQDPPSGPDGDDPGSDDPGADDPGGDGPAGDRDGTDGGPRTPPAPAVQGRPNLTG